MTVQDLAPNLDILKREYVLVQAWKKTSNYIRNHNWYSDTLELDWTTVNLRTFITEITEALEAPDQWASDPLRLVSAPKSCRWRVSDGDWKPEIPISRDRLRPLAHVSLRDQVVATALMLCLANRVETRQGDPCASYLEPASSSRVSSYGNRLFCDVSKDSELHHRWGSSKLYRSYFHDYRSFIERPAEVADAVKKRGGQRVFIVESDLSQFYDRVRPDHLNEALRSFQQVAGEQAFFDFARKVLNWRWDKRDEREIAAYTSAAELNDFSLIALPQGLVSAGFFSNSLLVSFDEALQSKVGEEFANGIRLEDACRYVDDLRIVVSTSHSAEKVQSEVMCGLQFLLDDNAPGLQLSQKKSRTVEIGGSQRPFVRQSRRMKQIQTAVSGGFDAIAGAEILNAVQGLMRSQERLRSESSKSGWQFSPLPDVRDETVARFSAGRFRTTYRSIRPLLEEFQDDSVNVASDKRTHIAMRRQRTKQGIDDDARAFALGLIERWVTDPSNVRLLRIGLDIYPDADVLKGILKLLTPLAHPGGRRKVPKRIAWYCLGELLRAGATETGFVDDHERLPTGINVVKYREVLGDEAERLINLPNVSIPWFLRQQALLFLAALFPEKASITRNSRSAEFIRYHKLLKFLRGQHEGLDSAEFATLAVLTKRAFAHADALVAMQPSSLSIDRKQGIAVRDPSFALELGGQDADFFRSLPKSVRGDLCLDIDPIEGEWTSLTAVVLQGGPRNPLRNELSLLRFARAFLTKLKERDTKSASIVAPGQIRMKLKVEENIAEVKELEVSPSQADAADSFYAVPPWCKDSDGWRLQLGFLLRFVLSGQPDFTIATRQEHGKACLKAYQPVRSHWYQRLYGLFNAQQAFGDDWVAITDWLEQFLLALLRWPGCRMPSDFRWVEHGIQHAKERICERIRQLEGKQGSATGTLILPLISSRPDSATSCRALRACVVQTVVPEHFDKGDLTLSGQDIRRRHRNHLSSALAAVQRMLELRNTHDARGRHLDWLILPELAVHPSDVRTHLVPFARAYKTLILAGLTYQELFDGEPMINSALWVIPEWTSDHGLQIRTRRQGKKHLANIEKGLNVQSFRPCQWLVGYPWSREHEPLWLTGSVCYDATDLALASDLRGQSDVFAIPSLNKDVKTFDQMAVALHYHMYQLVVVVNSGKFGGSNAYWPTENAHKRQVFHMHGQPQASIAFLDIKAEDMEGFQERRKTGKGSSRWKQPPAGLLAP